jgi:predicted transcriptional regulator of viral defense system
MKTPLIWKKLIINERRIITSEEIRKLALDLNKKDWESLDYLQKHGYIYRIFRGIFYVKSPDERERGFFQHSVYEMISKALKEKGVKQWYLGLETALKINNMTHEYFTVNFVITNSYRTTKIINILDTKFQFLKWSQKHFTFGILHKNGLKYSDKEKTILDLIYKRYRKDHITKYTISPLHEYGDLLDKIKLKNYLVNYPDRFRKNMKGIL